MTNDKKQTAKTSQLGKEKRIPSLSTNKTDSNMPEWLAPIFSALGSMGGSYLLFIKPLQDKVNDLTQQFREVKEEAKQLKQENVKCKEAIEKIIKQVEDIRKQQSQSSANGYDYFQLKKPNNQTGYLQKRI